MCILSLPPYPHLPYCQTRGQIKEENDIIECFICLILAWLNVLSCVFQKAGCVRYMEQISCSCCHG